MEIAELDALETDIDKMLRSFEKVQFENLSLKQKIASLARDRTLLSNKNQHAAGEIKRILNQLKEYIHE